jgi:hypothetical protein
VTWGGGETEVVVGFIGRGAGFGYKMQFFFSGDMLDGVRIDAPVFENKFMPLGALSHGLFDKDGFTALGSTVSSNIGNSRDTCCAGCCDGP